MSFLHSYGTLFLAIYGLKYILYSLYTLIVRITYKITYIAYSYIVLYYFQSFARTNFLLGMHGHVVNDAKYIRNKSIQTQHLQDCHNLSDKVTFSVIVFCFFSKSLFASSSY